MRNRQRSKYCIALILAAVFLLTFAVAATEEDTKHASVIFSESGATDQDNRTRYALCQQWNAIVAPEKRFDTVPSAQYPYATGKLSEGFIDQGLSWVNFFRFAAGLPPVTASDDANLSAQYGAVLLARMQQLTHSPLKPSDMSDAFYENGYNAINTSNISCIWFGGDSDSAEKQKAEEVMPMITLSYMDERGEFNRSGVPHRRWILDPTLRTIGIGCADDTDGAVYQVLKVLDTGEVASDVDYDFISWPASGVFPKQAISTNVPWSVTLNPDKFIVPGRNSLSITIKRESDNKTWTLNSKSSGASSSANFLCVDSQPYGVKNCIIFAFDTGEYGMYSGTYQVTISGIKTKSDQSAVLDYRIQFVDMVVCDHKWSEWICISQQTCTQDGLERRQCSECGAVEEKQSDALGHDWKMNFVTKPSEKYIRGLAEYVCTRCGEEKMDLLPLILCDGKNCPCRKFTDMPPITGWAHNGIDFVVENGIFNGTSATSFSPKRTMTRAMMVTVLWRMAGQPQSSATYRFMDVPKNAYFADAVRWAYEVDVAHGYTELHFGPNDLLTREQAVTMMYRFFGEDQTGSAENTIHAFVDYNQIDSYALEAVNWAVEQGILTGKLDENGNMIISPREDITREQVAAIIMRCME